MRRTLPRDLRVALGLGAGALAAMGLYATWIGGRIALKGETVPAFIGFVLTAVVGALAQYGKWVLDFYRGAELDDPETVEAPPPV